AKLALMVFARLSARCAKLALMVFARLSARCAKLALMVFARLSARCAKLALMVFARLSARCAKLALMVFARLSARCARLAAEDGSGPVCHGRAAAAHPDFSRLRLAARNLLFPAEHETGVGAAEAERIRERDPDRGAARLVGDVVELAVGVDGVEVDRRRQDRGLERANAQQRLDRACGAEQMPGHRFGRGHREAV